MIYIGKWYYLDTSTINQKRVVQSNQAYQFDMWLRSIRRLLAYTRRHAWINGQYIAGLNQLERLADIPEGYLTNRMPAEYTYDDLVAIPDSCEIHLRIYPSQTISPDAYGFIRVTCWCPICNKHVALGRLGQHMACHMPYVCSACHETMPLSTRSVHRRTCHSNG